MGSLLLKGLLFQSAVLHRDMKDDLPYRDGPMVEMLEEVVNSIAKTEAVHHRLETMPPNVGDEGPFTLDARKERNKTSQDLTPMLTPLQSNLLCVLREMQRLDKGIRNLKFGTEVTIPDDSGGEKTVAAEELRSEVTKWHQKFMKVEIELQANKASRHAPLEQQVVQLTAQKAQSDQQFQHYRKRAQDLEGEKDKMKREIDSLNREKDALAEENARIMKGNVPVIEGIDSMLKKTNEAVDRLNADGELFSSMFQIQVQENRKNVAERNEISQELSKVHRQLKSERLKSQFKEDELKKKEELYLRTIAARKTMHESYLDLKRQITEVEDKMQKREDEWQVMLKVKEGRESEIIELKATMLRASQRIDELEQQKKVIMEAFRKETGKSCNALLENFKALPTLSATATAMVPGGRDSLPALQSKN